MLHFLYFYFFSTTLARHYSIAGSQVYKGRKMWKIDSNIFWSTNWSRITNNTSSFSLPLPLWYLYPPTTTTRRSLPCAANRSRKTSLVLSHTHIHTHTNSRTHIHIGYRRPHPRSTFARGRRTLWRSMHIFFPLLVHPALIDNRIQFSRK